MNTVMGGSSTSTGPKDMIRASFNLLTGRKLSRQVHISGMERSREQEGIDILRVGGHIWCVSIGDISTSPGNPE